MADSNNPPDSSSAITASSSNSLAEAGDTSTTPPITINTLSKNKLRKQRNHVKVLAQRASKRQKEREIRKEKGPVKRRRIGNEEKQLLSEKLRNAFNTAPKVVIDCQYDDKMSVKEKTRLAQQLRRVYSSNKASDNPLHLILSSLSEDGEFFKICCKQNDGFSNYIVDRRRKSVRELFHKGEKLIYLTPDSPNVLSQFDSDVTYVIGGLVDETTNKNISFSFSQECDIATARLPIDEHFMAEEGQGMGTLKKVLTVNQVFDIILEWWKTKDWVTALLRGLPQRTGFVPRPTLTS